MTPQAQAATWWRKLLLLLIPDQLCTIPLKSGTAQSFVYQTQCSWQEVPGWGTA